MFCFHRRSRGRRPVLVALFAALVVSLTPLQARADEPATVDVLIDHALTDNPQLLARYHDWHATFAQADAARAAIPQPQVSYTTYVLAVQTRTGPQRHQVMLSQTLPWFRALRANAAPYAAQAQALEAQFDTTALTIVHDVEQALVSLARLDALTALMQARRRVYEDVLTHQETVMAHAPVGHGDVLRTALMVDVIDDQIGQLQGQRDGVMATLRNAVRWPEDTAFIVDVPPLESWAFPAVERGEVVAAMQAHHPAFRAADAQRDAAFATADAARLRRLPNPTVSLSWGVIGTYDTPMAEPSGRDVLAVGFSMPIPVFRRQYDAAADAALAQAEQATQTADDARWRFTELIDVALTERAEARRRLERLSRDLLPAVHDVTAHYEIALAHGDAPHTDYLLALEQELDLETLRVEALATLAQTAVTLHAVTARALTDDTMPTLPSSSLGGAQ